MSEPIKLPDLPRPPIHLSGWTNELCEWAKDYARRAVEQNTAGAKAECDALRAELTSIGDLDKRHAIARESGLAEWADWAQNRARHAALKEGNDD